MNSRFVANYCRLCFEVWWELNKAYLLVGTIVLITMALIAYLNKI
jgi:hypothetical protein